ncbi:MAG: 2-oxo acid dehydrogenase subunit E2 [Saprospiraceae bacterium]|nr:2-oxo acid dehydrogenase subunit E2 [Saprospiraceae bacterium]
MAQVELIMPKMGESIMEATILNWVKQVGDEVDVDETILEIATDKVDSEVPSPVKGVIKEILFKENDVVPIGTAIAIIGTEGEDAQPASTPSVAEPSSSSNGKSNSNGHAVENTPKEDAPVQAPATATTEIPKSSGNKFYSPLVRKIAQEEGVSVNELEGLSGSGMHGRVTKHDILGYLENRGTSVAAPQAKSTSVAPTAPVAKPATSVSGNVEIVEMDRMRKLIADHMVNSKRTSAHVTSFVEVDVTNMVNWREKVKGEFQKKYGEKITFTPLFMEAVAKALTDFPMVNVSVDGDKIIVKKNLNLGMATALPSGNLIVPVIKNAEQLNLVGLAKQVNDLANRARINKLKPEEIQDGSFTLTNVGTFGNLMGTPIINQPQVAIMATGAIKKKPAVVETEYGDLIAVRHMMFLSLSYDHRVVDGALGGSFLRRVGDYLEQFDAERTV